MTTYRPRDPDAAPPHEHPPYGSTTHRAPSQAPVPLAQTLSEITGPGPAVSELASRSLTPLDADLTHNAGTGQPALGERIIVTGHLRDDTEQALPGQLVEIWQCNAAGRYAHDRDTHDAPLDPNFVGRGRCVTDADGAYRFLTIRPGAYPWRNHPNAWRPAHIHFSVFGPALATRLVTQMYFPGDPLVEFDPILNSVPRQSWARLTATYDHDVTEPEWALGYRFDIILRGSDATPFEPVGASAFAATDTPVAETEPTAS